MKRIVIAMFVLVFLLVFYVNAYASDNDSAVLFDDFCVDFLSLCEQWDSEWDTSDVIEVYRDDDIVVADIDGIRIASSTCAENHHPVLYIKVAVNADSLTYKQTVRMCSLISTLDYEMPSTVSERKALLFRVSKASADRN